MQTTAKRTIGMVTVCGIAKSAKSIVRAKNQKALRTPLEKKVNESIRVLIKENSGLKSRRYSYVKKEIGPRQKPMTWHKLWETLFWRESHVNFSSVYLSQTASILRIGLCTSNT